MYFELPEDLIKDHYFKGSDRSHHLFYTFLLYLRKYIRKRKRKYIRYTKPSVIKDQLMGLNLSSCPGLFLVFLHLFGTQGFLETI